ncbi:MAG: hypothetical protein RSB95_05255 [Bacilli bacterium]
MIKAYNEKNGTRLLHFQIVDKIVSSTFGTSPDLFLKIVGQD